VAMDDKVVPFLEVADLMKIDFLASPPALWAEAARLAQEYDVDLLAEKVETEEVFEEAVQLGYTWFQGYFFARPNIIAGHALPASKVGHLRLLRETHRPEVDLGALERIIRGELSVSYQLLRYLNSAAFSWRRRITDIHHALVALGERELRKWISLVCLSGMAVDKPRELVVASIIRAQFCELMAPHAGLRDRSSDLFLTGLFSLLDALMDQPLADCLAELPLSPDVAAAVVEDRGPFAPMLAAARAYEEGDWPGVTAAARALGMSEERIGAAYVDAMRRADALLAGGLSD